MCHIVEILQLLVCSCATDIAADAPKPPSQMEGPVLALNVIDQELLLGKVLKGCAVLIFEGFFLEGYQRICSDRGYSEISNSCVLGKQTGL